MDNNSFFFNRWSERRHICSCDRICRCPTSQYDGYVPLVLLEHFSHGIGWIGLSHKRLENAKYCHVGSWNSRIAWLVVSVEAIHKSYKDFRLVTCFFFFYITSDFSLRWQSDPWICTLVDDKRKNRASKGNFPKNSKSEQNAYVRYGSKTSRRWSAFGRCSRTFCYTQNGTKNTFVLVLLVSLDAVFLLHFFIAFLNEYTSYILLCTFFALYYNHLILSWCFQPDRLVFGEFVSLPRVYLYWRITVRVLRFSKFQFWSEIRKRTTG